MPTITKKYRIKLSLFSDSSNRYHGTVAQTALFQIYPQGTVPVIPSLLGIAVMIFVISALGRGDLDGSSGNPGVAIVRLSVVPVPYGRFVSVHSIRIP